MINCTIKPKQTKLKFFFCTINDFGCFRSVIALFKLMNQCPKLDNIAHSSAWLSKSQTG